MKSKYVKIALIAVVAMVSAINVYHSKKSETLSDIALANVEALAYYVEGEFGEYECEAPFNVVCSVELGQILQGYRYDYE